MMTIFIFGSTITLRCSYFYCCSANVFTGKIPHNPQSRISSEGKRFPSADLTTDLSWSPEFSALTNKKLLGLKATSVLAVLHISQHYCQLPVGFCQCDPTLRQRQTCLTTSFPQLLTMLFWTNLTVCPLLSSRLTEPVLFAEQMPLKSSGIPSDAAHRTHTYMHTTKHFCHSLTLLHSINFHMQNYSSHTDDCCKRFVKTKSLFDIHL